MTVRENQTQRTAIHRKKLSVPARHLSSKGLLRGRVLDYGCGWGDDCQRLGIEGYDPFYRPKLPSGKFDTIMCNFVLNVLHLQEDRDKVLSTIKSMLKPDGKAYIAVRNDKSQLNGWTSRDTYQTFIDLDLPVVFKCSSCLIYEIG